MFFLVPLCAGFLGEASPYVHLPEVELGVASGSTATELLRGHAGLWWFGVDDYWGIDAEAGAFVNETRMLERTARQAEKAASSPRSAGGTPKAPSLAADSVHATNAPGTPGSAPGPALSPNAAAGPPLPTAATAPMQSPAAHAVATDDRPNAAPSRAHSRAGTL